MFDLVLLLSMLHHSFVRSLANGLQDLSPILFTDLADCPSEHGHGFGKSGLENGDNLVRINNPYQAEREVRDEFDRMKIN